MLSMEPWHTPITHQDSKLKAMLNHWGVQALAHPQRLEKCRVGTPTTCSLNSSVCSVQTLGAVENAVPYVVSLPEQINSAPGAYYPANTFVFPIPVKKENPKHFVLTCLGAMSLSS